MRVIAVTFADVAAANTALERLRTRFAMGPGDASVAPLGSVEGRGPAAVLAGRFEDRDVSEVRDLLVAGGGVVVSDVDESWTHSTAVPDDTIARSQGSSPST